MEPANQAANLARRVRVIELSVDDFLSLLDVFRARVLAEYGSFEDLDVDRSITEVRRLAEESLDALSDAAKGLQDLSEELIRED